MENLSRLRKGLSEEDGDDTPKRRRGGRRRGGEDDEGSAPDEDKGRSRGGDEDDGGRRRRRAKEAEEEEESGTRRGRRGDGDSDREKEKGISRDDDKSSSLAETKDSVDAVSTSTHNEAAYAVEERKKEMRKRRSRLVATITTYTCTLAAFRRPSIWMQAHHTVYKEARKRKEIMEFPHPITHLSLSPLRLKPTECQQRISLKCTYRVRSLAVRGLVLESRWCGRYRRKVTGSISTGQSKARPTTTTPMTIRTAFGPTQYRYGATPPMAKVHC